MSVVAQQVMKATVGTALADQPDDVPSGYVRTEIGIIPDDWQVRSIGSLARVLRGASPRPINDHKWFATESSTGWLRISDVTAAGKYLEHTTQRLSAAGMARSRFVAAGNLVMSICATVGRPVITKADVCIHDGFVVFDHPTVNTEFFYYVLAAIERDWVRHGQTGSQMNLNTGLIRSTPVAVPPGVEQCALADVLSDTDRLLGALEAVISKKREIKLACMQQLLTGKTRLPGFTGDWEAKRLRDHVLFLRNGMLSRAELDLSGPIKYLHYGDIHAASKLILDPLTAPLPSLPDRHARRLDRLQAGDVVFVDASEDLEGVGKSVEIANKAGFEVVAGLHTIAARFDKAVLADGFKAYLQFLPAFRDHLRRLAAGTKVYATNRSHVASVELRLPGVDEQRAIAAVLSDMDAEIEAVERQREKTLAIKHGMIQQLLTGRVRLVEPAHAETAL